MIAKSSMKPETEDVAACKEGDKFKEVPVEEPSSVVTSTSTSGITTGSSGNTRRSVAGLTGSSSTSKLPSTSSTSQKLSSIRELAEKLKAGKNRTTTFGAKQGASGIKEVPALDTVSDFQNRDPPSCRAPHNEGKRTRRGVARKKRRGPELTSPERLRSPQLLLETKFIKKTDSTEHSTRYTRVDELSRGDGTSPGAYHIGGSMQELSLSNEDTPSDISTVQPNATNDMDGTVGTVLVSNLTTPSARATETMLTAELVAPTIDAIRINDQGDSHSKDVAELVEQVNRRSKQNKILIVSLISLLLIGIAIGVTVVMTIGGTNDGTTRPTSVPTVDQTSSPTAAPITTSNFLSLREMILATSTESNFSHSFSPASMALAWIEADAYSNDKLEEEGAARATPSLMQRFALVVLYYAFNGPSSWQNDRGWLDDRSACTSWNQQDLNCNSNGEIAQINLHRVDGLSGTIPVELGLLTSLTKLDLARNAIEGTIPRSIGLLSKMQDLRLFENNLVGTLPSECRALAQMQHFSVTLNDLTGTIPDIGSMTQLTFLDLRSNRFTGEIPGGLAGLTSLQYLHLFNVEVSGTLPSTLCSTLLDAWIDCGEVVCDCCTGKSNEACPAVV